MLKPTNLDGVPRGLGPGGKSTNEGIFKPSTPDIALARTYLGSSVPDQFQGASTLSVSKIQKETPFPQSAFLVTRAGCLQTHEAADQLATSFTQTDKARLLFSKQTWSQR
jgi:hypothetical protein